MIQTDKIFSWVFVLILCGCAQQAPVLGPGKHSEILLPLGADRAEDGLRQGQLVITVGESHGREAIDLAENTRKSR